MKNVFLTLLVMAALVSWPTAARAERLRDMTEVAGVRDNQLVGFGLVTGLGGTGDDTSVPFAQQAVLSMLRRLRLQADSTQIRLRNVAAVTVTATLPPFAKAGTKIDVTVSSIGNARSLSGGVLIQTVLKGANQRPYAVAQGGSSSAGFRPRARAEAVFRAVRQRPREFPREPWSSARSWSRSLRVVSFGSSSASRDSQVASRVVEAVNEKFIGAASAVDGGAVDIHLPREYESRVVDFVAEIEDIEVVPLHRARVVINRAHGDHCRWRRRSPVGGRYRPWQSHDHGQGGADAVSTDDSLGRWKHGCDAEDRHRGYRTPTHHEVCPGGPHTFRCGDDAGTLGRVAARIGKCLGALVRPVPSKRRL